MQGCWTEGFSFLATVVRGNPLFLVTWCLCGTAHNTAAGFTKTALGDGLLARWKFQSSVRSWGRGHLGCIPLARSTSQVLPTLSGRHGYLEARPTGPFRVCPPQGSANFYKRLEKTHFRPAGQRVSVRSLPCNTRSAVDRLLTKECVSIELY